MTRRAWPLLLAVLTMATAPASAQRPEVFVSAAVSLSEVLRQIVPLYESRTGTRVVLNLAASNALARQVAAGAPVDLFISADDRQMAAAGERLLAGSRVDLLSNRLAVAVPSDRPATLRSMRDLANAPYRRIALGDPAAVPAGAYARAHLQALGLWPALAPKLVPSGSVRLALAAVENGAVDAAIVYETDVRTSRRARLAYVVPAAEGPKIVYPAAVIRSPRQQEALRLLEFLRGAEAATIFARAGFIPLGAHGSR